MKKIYILLISFSLAFLVACSSQVYLFERGFNYVQHGTGISVAVSSDSLYHSRDDFSLRLHFGWNSNRPPDTEAYDPNYIIYGPVIYIFHSAEIDDFLREESRNLDNYQIVTGGQFIRRIPIIEFQSENYRAVTRRRRRTVFNHFEYITIPNEFIDTNDGITSITILLTYITFDYSEERYFFGDSSSIRLFLEINDDNIRLF